MFLLHLTLNTSSSFSKYIVRVGCVHVLFFNFWSALDVGHQCRSTNNFFNWIFSFCLLLFCFVSFPFSCFFSVDLTGQKKATSFKYLPNANGTKKVPRLSANVAPRLVAQVFLILQTNATTWFCDWRYKQQLYYSFDHNSENVSPINYTFTHHWRTTTMMPRYTMEKKTKYKRKENLTTKKNWGVNGGAKPGSKTVRNKNLIQYVGPNCGDAKMKVVAASRFANGKSNTQNRCEGATKRCEIIIKTKKKYGRKVINFKSSQLVVLPSFGFGQASWCCSQLLLWYEKKTKIKIRKIKISWRFPSVVALNWTKPKARGSCQRKWEKWHFKRFAFVCTWLWLPGIWYWDVGNIHLVGKKNS